MQRTRRTIFLATLAATGLTAGALAAGTAMAQSTDATRGALLYENHCQSCHTTEVHFRSERKSRTLADVRAWVARWQETLKLGWSAEEVDDVTGHLDERFYHFAD